MLEYTLAIILIVVTIISAIISTKAPLVGMIVFIVDIIMLMDVALNPTLIMGYEVVGGTLQTVTQVYPELQMLTIVAIILNIGGTLYGTIETLSRR